MREFVYGTDKQFAQLKKSLGDGQCHVYTCAFPDSFSASEGRMGFEKDDVSYILYIDRGISCRGKSPSLLKNWLEAGQLRFLDFSDMRDFLRSLSFLYPALQSGNEVRSGE